MISAQRAEDPIVTGKPHMEGGMKDRRSSQYQHDAGTKIASMVSEEMAMASIWPVNHVGSTSIHLRLS